MVKKRSCDRQPAVPASTLNMLYNVQHITGPKAGAASWDADPWRDLATATLLHHMGPRPGHFPETGVKMAYDDTSIMLLFRVQDRFIRSTATRHQQSVCADSCIEFFFAPGPDTARGYFNLEINCGGTMLFHFHPTAERSNVIMPPASLCDRIQCLHSLPKIVDPEITTPATWTIFARIPLDILEEYVHTVRLAPGTIWRGNFYKCADASSHPHWLTWAPVEAPKPDFHLPQYFGTLEFH